MADLLIELGCEELPAASVRPMAGQLATAVHALLDTAGLVEALPASHGTPRRLAALWQDVPAVQPEQVVERRGPSVKAAYDNGQPTRALQGFLRSSNATAEQLSTVQTPKGEWLVLRQRQPGRSLEHILAEALPGIVASLSAGRRMRWSDLPYEFARPVQWLVVMHGTAVLDVSVFGLQAGRTTRGHRFLAPEPVSLRDAADYVDQLGAASVMVDIDMRREHIVETVMASAGSIGGTARMDDELVDEVTSLVEWPVALAGRFDEAFLEIPDEALIQTMQENQRYFPVVDGDGTLMPAFITVANITSSCPQTVIDGNERVIRPRFADTMFFFDQDRQQPLEALAPELARLSFQERLGSVADKVTRMERVAVWLADTLGVSDTECRLAVGLCKCDLASEIVKELPKMQGIAGRHYARRDGHPEAVVEAIQSHYLPRHAGDELPQDGVGQTLALADRIDTLVGIFGVGNKPRGASDPFGLRRAALGIVRILIERRVDVSLPDLVAQSRASYGELLDGDEAAAADVVAWIIDRLRAYALEQGYPADVIDAVLARQAGHPLDIAVRLDAIDRFRGSEAAESLAAAGKRIGNLLRRIEPADRSQVDESRFTEAAERALFDAMEAVSDDIRAHLRSRDYNAAMTLTAELRAPLDRFFDEVMVMADDPALQANRLALLAALQDLCSCTAELAHLQPRSDTADADH